MIANELKSRIFACLEVADVARIRENLSVLELVPEKFLRQYCEIKRVDYEFMVQVFDLCHRISRQSVNTSLSKTYVFYDCFKSRTGRLTTCPNSLPILTMKKEEREQILPNNDIFLKLDYNAAEIRVFLGLLGSDQPTEDIHQYHRSLGNFGGREEAKKEFFRWLYNSGVENKIFEGLYSRERLLYQFFQNGIVCNPFQRKMTSDQFHATNYLVQSTTVDLVHEQALKIVKILNTHKTTLAFLIHDEVILDVKKAEWGKIKQVVEVFQDTRYGKFPISVKIGKNLGEMKKIEI